MKKAITQFIDSFYFLFRSFLPLKTYRYAVCGGGNLLFDIFLYFIFYNFIFAKQNLNLYFIVLSPHIASLFVVFPITFTTGFLLNRYITFEYSNLPWKTQLFRYFLVGMGSLLLSYVGLKFLVDYLGFFPTPSKILTIFVTVTYSYLLQNYFSFRVRRTEKI
ncbi:GtrA family protein [Aequorivita sp. H23M31]|uniref:GtrA family protein n=1 Tax=Aequorivita ciconiae TaxID=2494375 RepID=A0A410G681_9FLAO|nr:GtrA family protein [Aequorivita sp. H23M31]QAA82750.1 GtrA family protein [Aequorivita sp. H23M31]